MRVILTGAAGFIGSCFLWKLNSMGIDDVIAKVPKLTMAEVTRAYDFHARRLRLVDAAIQNANWTTDIDCDESVMKDYEPETAAE